MKKIGLLSFIIISLFTLTSCSIEVGFAIDWIGSIPAEIVSSLLILLIALIVFLIVFFKARKTDPLKKPKGIMIIAEMAVEKMDNLVVETMGKRFASFTPYAIAVGVYIFLCFIIGILGFASPMTYFMVPFSIALCTFILIHATSVKYTKWRYFKRYIDPFPIFLPVNLLSMWAPLLSLSFRLFGNAISGWVLMQILYSALESLSNLVFGLPYFVAPIIAPVLHAYFDIFSGFIQALVFLMVSMLLIAQEAPEEDEEYTQIEPVSK